MTSIQEVKGDTARGLRKKALDIRMERTDGILQITFDTDGGTMIFGPEAHEQIPPAFLDIAQDPDNRGLIMTGLGDAFIDEVETAKLEGVPGEGKPTSQLDEDVAAHLGPEKVLPRAWDLAGQILRQPPLTVHYTKVVMTLELKELCQRHLSHGLALTGLAANEFWPNS